MSHSLLSSLNFSRPLLIDMEERLQCVTGLTDTESCQALQEVYKQKGLRA